MYPAGQSLFPQLLQSPERWRQCMRNSVLNKLFLVGLIGNIGLISCGQNSPEKYLLNGDNYYRQKEYDKAIDQYNKAIDMKGDFIIAYINKGAAYEYQKKFDQAIYNYNTLLEIIPNQPDVLARRGISYISIQKYELALIDLQNANSSRPNDPNILSNLGLCKITMQNSTGIKDLDKSISIDSLNYMAFYNRGLGKLLIKDNKGALQDFLNSLKLKSNNGESLCGVGIAKLQLGDKESACRYWQLSIEAGYKRAQILIDTNCQ